VNWRKYSQLTRPASRTVCPLSPALSPRRRRERVIWQTLLACFSPAIYRRDSFCRQILMQLAMATRTLYLRSTSANLRRLHRLHDRMPGRMEMLWSRAYSWTNHSSRRARRSGRYAGEPRYRRLQTILAAPGRRLNIMNLIDMGAYSPATDVILKHRQQPKVKGKVNALKLPLEILRGLA